MKNSGITNKCILTGLFYLILILSGSVVSGQSNKKLDSLISKETEAFKIPNSVILWVKDGQVTYKNIYWDSTLSGNHPIDPEKSLFRVASISKPFTGLAALSMINEGLLDLNTDINTYFEEPLLNYRFNKPIKIKHLLTHTAGFDDFYINKSARTREDLNTLEYNIRSLMPRQVLVPGEVSTYSNFGVALLGYIMEKASGDIFADVVKKRVFMPFGMSASTFDPEVYDKSDIVKGWINKNGNMQAVPFDYIKDVPAGQMLTSVNDMISFMKMITDHAFDSLNSLQMKELFRQSTSLQFTHHPKLQGGIASLWSLINFSGYDVIMHDGGYPGIASRFFYFPEHDQALFVFSSNMDFRFISAVTNTLISEFLPETVAGSSVRNIERKEINDKPDLKDFSGHYRNTRYSRSSMLKIASLFGFMGVGGELKIGNDGEHLTMPDHTGKMRKLVRADTLLFSSLDDPYDMAFRQAKGKITHVFTSGTSALEKISFWESSGFQIIFLAVSVSLFAVIVLLGLSKALIRIVRGPAKPESLGFLLAIGISFVFLLQLMLLYLGGAGLEVYELQTGFAYGVPSLFYIANILPYISLIFIVALSYFTVKRKMSAWSFLSSAIFIIISAGYFVCLYYWNLTGWKF